MKKILKAMLRRMIPTVVEFLEDQVKDWIADPNTDTDEKAVEAVGNFVEYLLKRYVD